MSGDNWNLEPVIVKAIGAEVNKLQFPDSPKRFTGDSKTLPLR
jgi:hypothetical protein